MSALRNKGQPQAFSCPCRFHAEARSGLFPRAPSTLELPGAAGAGVCSRNLEAWPYSMTAAPLVPRCYQSEVAAQAVRENV